MEERPQHQDHNSPLVTTFKYSAIKENFQNILRAKKSDKYFPQKLTAFSISLDIPRIFNTHFTEFIFITRSRHEIPYTGNP